MLLFEFLYQHYNKKVVILIDEYDTPINSASTQDRDGIAKLMSNLLGSCLKDNNMYLEKALIMGILRGAEADIISDLRNSSVNSLLDNTFESFFGLTEKEVSDL